MLHLLFDSAFAKLFPHILLNGKFYLPLHSLNRGNKSGEVVEWSITAVLKTVELRGSGGSNPSLSARNNMNEADSKGQLFFHLSSCPVAE